MILFFIFINIVLGCYIVYSLNRPVRLLSGAPEPLTGSALPKPPLLLLLWQEFERAIEILGRFSNTGRHPSLSNPLSMRETAAPYRVVVQDLHQVEQAVSLPDPAMLNTFFSDYFVLYEPRQQSSGDFYWCVRKDDKIYMAVVDCAGKARTAGVAYLVANAVFTRLIHKNNITDPAILLHTLHSEIIRADLPLCTKNNHGLEIALCVVEKQQNGQVKVSFAGAKRPFLYTHGQGLHEIKGVRRTIGGINKSEEAIAFENHELLLEKGDAIYLATDGFSNLRNETRQKYTLEGLRLLLSRIAPKDMEAQKNELIAEMNRHRGEAKQRNDITLLGVRI